MSVRTWMIAGLTGLVLLGVWVFVDRQESTAPEGAAIAAARGPAPAEELPETPAGSGDEPVADAPVADAPGSDRRSGVDDPDAAAAPGRDAPVVVAEDAGTDAAPAAEPAGRAGGAGGAEPPEPQQGSEPASDADPAPSDEILRATSRAYEGLRSFRAGFEQELQNTLLGRTTRSEGTLYQRQPDRFLMDFSDPEGDLIVSDGEYFWMYFPSVDAKQVLRTPRGGQGLDLRAQFVGDPVRRFEATYHGAEAVRGRTADVLTLVPREPLGYERLKVWIDRSDHLVRRFELTESNGNIRHFELHDMVRNPTLPDDLFEFTPPPGSQVVTR